MILRFHIMNKIQFSKLQLFDDNFIRVIDAGYFLPMKKHEYKLLVEVYNELSGDIMSSTCQKCLLEAFKYIAPVYFKYKKKVEQKSKEDGKENREA